MGRTITVGGGNAPDPDVVELFDRRYTVREVTRSVQKKLESAEQKLKALADDEDDADKVMAVMAEGIDVLLAPVDHDEPARKVLVQAWKDDRMSLGAFQRLYADIQESSEQRPT